MRKLVAGFIALATMALLAACGAGGEEDAAIQLMLFGDPVETQGYQAMIAAFSAKVPGITVNLTPVADQDELLAKLSTAFAGDSPPDTFLINYRKYGLFAGQDALEPVQSYLDDSEAISEDEYAPAALDAFRFDGETLTCMPQNVSSLSVYYNVDMFEQAGVELPTAGWTWDDFLAAAKTLTTGGNYGVGVEPSLIRVAPFVWSNGGEVVDDPVEPTTLAFDDPKAQEALDFFLDLQLEHGVVPPQREELSEDSESRFLNGTLGMFLDSRKAVPTLRTIEDFEWDVAPLPVAPGGQPATILHGDAYCMAKDSPNKEATWRFIEFAMGEEGQQILAESGRTVPSRLDVASSPAFLDPDKPPASSQVFIDAIPNVRAVPHTETWSKVEGEADTVLEGMFYGTTERADGLQQLIEKTTPLFGGG
jgi:multiple sugar transport system substrate-binding protein